MTIGEYTKSAYLTRSQLIPLKGCAAVMTSKDSVDSCKYVSIIRH